MSDSAISNIPWTSIAVLAAFVSSTLLVPQAFDRMRPPEKERAQPAVANELEVDARLWEDPFMAYRRHEADRTERCARIGSSDAKPRPKECDDDRLKDRRAPSTMLSQMLRDGGDGGDDGEAPRAATPPTAPPQAPAAAVQADAKLVKTVAHGAPKARRDSPGKADTNAKPHAFPDMSDHLVMAVLVPGNPFVGAEESRRRTRYAILSGLQAMDFVPMNAERMGVLEFRWGKDKATETYVAPFELLVRRRADARGESADLRASSYRSIAVLWVNEAALPTPRLDALAHVLHDVFKGAGQPPMLTIVGPSSSDALQTALRELRDASEKPPANPDVLAGYAHVARAQILSPSATAPNRALAELRRWKASRAAANEPAASDAGDDGLPQNSLMERFLVEKLAPFHASGLLTPEIHFQRTIATDSKLLKSLVSELHLRLPPQARRRIVLLAERDSLYSQALVSEFRARLEQKKWPRSRECEFPHQGEPIDDRYRPDVEVVYFYRGIDGVTMRDGQDKSSSDKGDKRDSPVEWPEARDQLDYLRRLAGMLKSSETHGRFASDAGVVTAEKSATRSVEQPAPIGAIGVFAADVHDKLLVLQALRDNFPDKIFFTTDMDARYLHPEVVGFTRNLVVASSLPISFAASAAQAGVPPFRDVYQSSAYVAARRAACRTADCRLAETAQFKDALNCPSIYEVGRTGPVAVEGHDLRSRPVPSKGPRGVVAAILVLFIAGALFVWPSTPSMLAVRAFLLDEKPCLPGERDHLSGASVVIVSLHFALLVFIIGSTVEFVHQSGLTASRIGWVAAAVATAVLVGLLAQRKLKEDGPSWTKPFGVGLQNRLALSGAIFATVASVSIWLLWPQIKPEACHDCEPAAWLEGVSAWPSHLLHITAMFVIVWALDDLWSHARRSRHLDQEWLGTGQIAGCRKDEPCGWLMRLRMWIENNSLAFWRRAENKGVDFASLWCQYIQRGRGPARLIRVLFWWGVTVAVVYLLFKGFSEGYAPEVPVRGFGHRQIIAGTFYTLLVLLPLLVVAVADAHMLACRFIWHLGGGRSFYPPQTLERFANELGSEHVVLWKGRIARDPARRTDTAENARSDHTLLDDWIDMQVVERRTAMVAPLIIGPFVVLALMVVARSRLLDSWAVTLPIALAASAYCLWLFVLASLLRYAAQEARRKALERMRADQRWLEGAGEELKPLVEPFGKLIESVENKRSGAFAPFFDQPLFKAILVPLGGAGGSQLFDRLLLAH